MHRTLVDAKAGDYRSSPLVNRHIVAILALGLWACGAPRPWSRVDAAHEAITRLHLLPPSDDALADAALRSMVAELDPHSAYLSADELRWFEEDVRGSYGGVGFEVVPDGDVWRIVVVVPGGPAEGGGLRAGDRVLAVNGLVPGKTQRVVLLAALRGPVGGFVSLRVETPSTPARDLVLARAMVSAQSVILEAPREGDDGLATVHLRQFQEATSEAFDDVVRTLTETRKTQGIVLDLRGNPGGLVDVARHVADQWIASGPIHGMAMRGHEYREVLATPEAPLMHVPTVVIVDSSTASAGELLAAALRDRVGATLVGERTFGKGTVQVLEKLLGGGALDLTIGEYRTACGASIQAIGLTPDLVFAGPVPSFEKVQREEDLPRVIVLDAPHERAPTVQIDSLTPIVRASARGVDDATLRRAQDELKRRVNAGEVPAQRGCRF